MALNEYCDIAIAGAGAAGLAAGIFAAEGASERGLLRPRIILLDGAKTLGAKILVSGGGRCNVTHDQIFPEDYCGPRTIVRNILAGFNEQKTIRWMESLGIQLKREETGKLFPVTDSARTVLNALLGRLGELGVEVRTGCRVTGVEEMRRWGDAERIGEGTEGHRNTKTPAQTGAGADSSVPPSPPLLISSPPHLPLSPPFRILHSQGELGAGKVILCTGGRSLPKTGSDGGGWEIARRLGHTVTDTWPALVPLVLEPGMFHADVSGLSHEAALATFVEGKLVDYRTGSLLWTHFGISGPVVMDASRFWVIARGRGLRVELRCSFLPGQSFEQAEKGLLDQAKARPRLSIANAVGQRLPERLADALLQRAGIERSLPMGQLTRDQRRKLVHTLTDLALPVARDRGWNYAEVTAGGVPVEEIDFRTMASRKVPGLFLAGEILDCDGRIGGFNFQWAWATGYLAGRGASKSEIRIKSR